MDGDGDVDVLSASETVDKIEWFENDGSRPPNFTEHVLTEDPDGLYGPLRGVAEGAWFVSAVDLDRDGDMDVLFTAAEANLVAWFENQGGQPPVFTMRTIVVSVFPYYPVSQPISASPADVDGDGDVDVLIGSRGSGLQWLENDSASPPRFTLHAIAASGIRTSVFTADLDADGDVDAVTAAYGENQIQWYENLGGTPVSFAEHTISDGMDLGESVFAADLDGDDDLDVLSASSTCGFCARHADGRIRWYPNHVVLPSHY
jgi:hypothetical protein